MKARAKRWNNQQLATLIGLLVLIGVLIVWQSQAAPGNKAAGKPVKLIEAKQYDRDTAPPGQQEDVAEPDEMAPDYSERLAESDNVETDRAEE